MEMTCLVKKISQLPPMRSSGMPWTTCSLVCLDCVHIHARQVFRRSCQRGMSFASSMRSVGCAARCSRIRMLSDKNSRKSAPCHTYYIKLLCRVLLRMYCSLRSPSARPPASAGPCRCHRGSCAVPSPHRAFARPSSRPAHSTCQSARRTA